MKEKLTHNMGLKVLSILLGFSLWLLVANEANPKTTDDREVAIDIVNEEILDEAGKTYEILGKSNVTVSYEVNVLDQYKISAADFRAYVDLADLYEPTGAIPVKIEVRNNSSLINSVSASPEVIRIQTEDLQRKQFDLEVLVKGAAADGYEIGTATLSPSYVYVSGPTSLVGQISKVGIEIDAEGAEANLQGTAAPVFYDANNMPLTEFGTRVTTNQAEIDYELSILKVKNVNIDFDVSGQVAEGYRYTGIECDVRSVPIQGMKSVLASIGTITVPGTDVSIEGLSADRTVTIDLNNYLPPGVDIVGEENNMISVTMKVEPLATKEFILEPSDIVQTGASNKYNYTYSEEFVTVTVEGLQEDLANLRERSLNTAIDFTGLTPGEHPGELTFDAGEGFEVLDYTEFVITVALKEERDGTVSQTSGSGTTEAETEESQEETE